MNLEMRLTKETIDLILCVHVAHRDLASVLKWLTTKNEHFDGFSPLYLVNTGRVGKVNKFVKEEMLGEK